MRENGPRRNLSLYLICRDLLTYLRSGASHEEFFFWLAFCLRDVAVRCHVLHELTPPFRTFALKHTDAAGGHVAGFEAKDAALPNLNLRAKPIGAKNSTCGS